MDPGKNTSQREQPYYLTRDIALCVRLVWSIVRRLSPFMQMLNAKDTIAHCITSRQLSFLMTLSSPICDKSCTGESWRMRTPCLPCGFMFTIGPRNQLWATWVLWRKSQWDPRKMRLTMGRRAHCCGRKNYPRLSWQLIWSPMDYNNTVDYRWGCKVGQRVPKQRVWLRLGPAGG